MEDEVLFAQLLAGHRIDDTDAILPMNAEAMEKVWARLRETLKDSGGSQPMLARQSSRPLVEEEYYVPGEDSEAMLSNYNNPYRKQLAAIWNEVNPDLHLAYFSNLTPSISNQFTGFLELCSTAIEAEPNPQHGGPYEHRARVYERLGRYQKAIDDMREWLWRIGPLPNKAWLVKQYFMLGRCHWNLGETEKAEAYLQRAQECSNEDAEACSFLARSYATGPTNFCSFEKALPLALKAVELSKTNLTYAMNLAEVYSRLAQPQKAINVLEKAIELQPDADSLSCYNNLAWLFVTGPAELRSPQKALPLALKAVELGKTNHNELNTLGVVYYRLGQLTNAITTLETGIQADKEGGSAYDFLILAMCYHGLGITTKAQDYFAKATNWMNAQTNLASSAMAELESFRAEAVEVLRKHPSATE